MPAAKKAPSGKSFSSLAQAVAAHKISSVQIMTGNSILTPMIGAHAQANFPLPPFINCDAPTVENGDDFDDYIKLARELNISNNAFYIELFQRVLKDHEMKIYNENRTVRYLNETYKAGWYTYPVRVRDFDLTDYILNSNQGVAASYEISKYCYSGVIPISVLEKMSNIEAAIPEAYFYVLSARHGEDKFMLTTAKTGAPKFIFAHWTKQNFME